MQDEVGAVGAEDTRGVAFRRADGAGVFEEGTEFGDGDRQVAAQQPFSEVVVEGPADGDLRKATPPEWAGVCQEYSCASSKRRRASKNGGSRLCW